MDILQHLSADNHAPCLVFPDHVVSYAAMKARVDDMVRRMGPSRRLMALEAAPSEEFIVTYLAALAASHPMALLPPGDEEAAATFRADFGPALSFFEADGGWHMAEHTPRAGGIHPDLAVMLATSGSEGRPHWVRLSRGNIAANAGSIAQYLGLTAA